ncbi:kelch-like [Perkinsus olseni]|uniref:Kelch-like n=1 Tax=Perkinsus olseni TaxID=32597 RepID=A0A7J6SPW2_PEROL|nr:kelch-like [Perkinsus olseni]
MALRCSSTLSEPPVRDRWVDRHGGQIATLLSLASQQEDPATCPFASIPLETVSFYIVPYIHYDEPVRDCIMVCGGRSTNIIGYDDCLSSVEVYDDYSKKWHKVSSMHQQRVAGAAVAVGDNLYVAGGYQDRLRQTLGCVEVYNPWRDHWERLRSSMSHPRFGHSLTLVGAKYLYAIGGVSQGQLVSKVEVLDTETNMWLRQPQPEMPRPLAGGRVIEKDGQLFVVGGDLRSSPREFSDLIYILDTTLKPHIWSVLSVRLSAGRSGCAVAWLDDSRSCIGVFGGYVIIDGESQAVATSEIVPLEGTHPVPLEDTDVHGRVLPAVSARRIPEMPSPRAGCRAVTVGCRVMLVGGESPVASAVDEVGARATRRCSILLSRARSTTDAAYRQRLRFMAYELQGLTNRTTQSVRGSGALAPRSVAHDIILIFDSSEWAWVASETPLMQGRTAAAVSVGVAFSLSYACSSYYPRYPSTGSRKRSRID